MMRNVYVVVLSLALTLSKWVFADGPMGSPAGTAAAPAAPAAQGPTLAMNLFPMILIFGVIYFLMIRPQQKKMKEQQEMLASLKHGDEVLTTSGILGKVTGIADKVVTVEIADDVRVKMLKSQISQVIKGQIKDIA